MSLFPHVNDWMDFAEVTADVPPRKE